MKIKCMLLIVLVGYIGIMHSKKAYASDSLGTIQTSFSLTKICKDISCTAFGTINFKPTINVNTPGALPVTITDTGMTGHAWGDEIGWINMSPTGSGVYINPITGILSGEAYANSGSWINFAPTYSGSGPQVGVTLVDNGSGSNFQGWAWVSGVHGGWLKFDCIGTGTCVKTDWRAVPYRTVCSDGIDNDGDGLIDYPADLGCSNPNDTDETNNLPNSNGGTLSGGCTAPAIYSNGICVIPTVPEIIVPIPIIPDDRGELCKPYIIKYIKLGAKNNSIEVKKLQQFLVTYELEKLDIDGIYKQNDYDAVKRFQSKYSADILSPWNIQSPTGYVYKTTVTKINKIICPDLVIKKPITNSVAEKTCPVFTTYHWVGSIGGDIERIRTFLNEQFPHLKLKKTFMYTKTMSNAVKLYQQTYYSDIIVPAGLSRVTGIWAHFSVAQANRLLGCQ